MSTSGEKFVTLPTILLVDDEAAVRQSIEQSLQLAGYQVKSFSSANAVLAHLGSDFFGVLLSDIRMPDMDGIELMHEALKVDAQLPVILISGHADVSTAVSAIRDGAYDLIEKPFSASLLLDRVKRAVEQRKLTLENRRLKEALESQNRIGPRIIGESSVMLNLRKMVSLIANAEADVLIYGETGTGKELFARSLHEQSKRRDHNYVAINCGAISEQLLESELFGHEAGAFTDAKKRRVGKFEHANGGTVFLDEIESMSPATQVSLLRVLQERSIERLGSNHLIPLDIRVIAATKIDLKEAAERKEFREDLYYRLNVVTLDLPPLRDRRDDIPLLFQHFVLVASARCETEVPPLNRKALHTLLEHHWPGNIRELRNMAERYVLLGESVNFDFPTLMNSTEMPAGLTLPDQVACFEKTLIIQALTNQKGCIKAAMESLGLPRKTLTDKMKKYGLERWRFLKSS